MSIYLNQLWWMCGPWSPSITLYGLSTNLLFRFFIHHSASLMSLLSRWTYRCHCVHMFELSDDFPTPCIQIHDIGIEYQYVQVCSRSVLHILNVWVCDLINKSSLVPTTHPKSNRTHKIVLCPTVQVLGLVVIYSDRWDISCHISTNRIMINEWFGITFF